MGIKFKSYSLRRDFCYLLVNWTESWNILVFSNIWLQLSIIIYPNLSHPSDLESQRTKTALEPHWKGPYQGDYSDGCQTLRTLNLHPHMLAKNFSSAVLELHTSWRSKIKMDQGGSSSKANDILKGTAPPRSQTKSLTFSNVCVSICSVVQFCLTLSSPMDCCPPSSSVHGIFQARILGLVSISSSRGSSRPRDPTCISYVSCTGRGVLYHNMKALFSFAFSLLAFSLCYIWLDDKKRRIVKLLKHGGHETEVALMPWEQAGKSKTKFECFKIKKSKP